MEVGGEDTVIAIGAESIIEKCTGGERIGLTGLIGHLCGFLVDVDDRAIEVGEAHWHAGAGK